MPKNKIVAMYRVKNEARTSIWVASIWEILKISLMLNDGVPL